MEGDDAAKTAGLGFIGRPERDTSTRPTLLSTLGRDNHLITPDAGRRVHAILRKGNKKESPVLMAFAPCTRCLEIIRYVTDEVETKVESVVILTI